MIKNREIKKLTLKYIKTVILGAFGLIFILPLIWMVSTSFKGPLEVDSFPIDWIPNTFHWENYKKIFTEKDAPYFLYYFNSIKITVMIIIGRLLASSMAAYAFAKMKFAGKNVVFMTLAATMMIPIQIILIPRFFLFHKIGLYNNHWSVIIPGFLHVSSIILLKVFYEGIPNELVEAAKVDGAKHLFIWSKIMIPLTKHVMASLMVLTFIWTWNDYLTPLIFLVSKELHPISIGVLYYYKQDPPIVNLTMASATCAIIPIILLFIFSQKYFIESIVTSGIKG